MGQPVVHFEIVGRDGQALRAFYSELFGWDIDANNPAVGGTRLLGPDEVMGGVESAAFSDPEGHLIGLVRSAF